MICFAGDLKVLKIIVAVGLLVSPSCDGLSGRKCVCTSKACKESGAKTCRTRFSCYTELIYSSGEATAAAAATASASSGVHQAIKTTRGCTEGAPLLCETKTLRASEEQQQQDSGNSNLLEQLGRMAWPRLTCCDDRDYCNAADEDFETTSVRPEDRDENHESRPELPSNRAYDYRARSAVASDDAKVHPSSQTLHVAALLLAIAALISVFAACYVVTRFLNAGNGASSSLSRILNPYSDGGGVDV